MEGASGRVSLTDLSTEVIAASFHRCVKPCPFSYEESKQFLKTGVSHALPQMSAHIMKSMEGSSPASLRAEVTFNSSISK